jgi:hypothetical protein
MLHNVAGVPQTNSFYTVFPHVTLFIPLAVAFFIVEYRFPTHYPSTKVSSIDAIDGLNG